MSKKNWKGLKPNRFRPYRDWINRQYPGICGTYCSAVLLHDRVLHDTGYKLDKEELLTIFKKTIDEHFPYRGTFFWDLERGLNQVLKDVSHLRTKSHLFSERVVPALLDQEDVYPVIVGTLRLFGSRYGNHWLVCYSYRYDENNQLIYRCYDNHGKYRVEISAKETLACIWIEEI